MWEIPAANVRISARLGRGAYGGLFDAEITLPNGQFARALVKVRDTVAFTAELFIGMSSGY